MTGTMHLLCGSTGAGKTSYARQLAAEVGGVRFSIDEWMSALFWMDAPDPFTPAWAMERVERSAAMIWNTAAGICARGVPCVLEIGLTTAAKRAHYVGLARAAGFAVKLHVVEAPVEERWRRVQDRNDAPDADQLPFKLTREMFDFVEAMWERPDAQELAALDGLVVDSGGARD